MGKLTVAEEQIGGQVRKKQIAVEGDQPAKGRKRHRGEESDAQEVSHPRGQTPRPVAAPRGLPADAATPCAAQAGLQ